MRWSVDCEAEGLFEVRLFEGREDAAGVWHFELGVKVDLAIDWVDETVEAFTGRGVTEIRVDLQHVLRLQARKLNAEFVCVGGRVELLTVEVDGVDALGDRIDKRGSTRLRPECDGGFSAEGFATGCEIKVNVRGLGH